MLYRDNIREHSVNFARKSLNLSLEKQSIADAFGRAAHHYDQHAQFQRQVGHQLMASLPNDLTGLTVLDLGCGTGYFSLLLAQKGATVTCVDLCVKMLQQAQIRCGELVAHYQQADAEKLPFADEQFDIVISNLALQWCDNLALPLQQMAKVTKPGGQILFSTLAQGSLTELNRAWQSVDNHRHVNDFISSNAIKIALAQIDSVQSHLELSTFRLWYPTALDLMRDLKGIGATHISGRTQGLTNRRALQHVEQCYRQWQNTQGLLPATYEVCLGVIQR